MLSARSFCLPAKHGIVSPLYHYYALPSEGYTSVVLALWNGDIVQKNNEDHDIDCWCSLAFSFFLVIDSSSDVIYRESRPTSFLDPSRLAVPKYVRHVRKEPVFHPFLDTRITSKLQCGCSFSPFTASLVRDVISSCGRRIRT